MCVGLSTNNWNELWVSPLWVEVPAPGAAQCSSWLDWGCLCVPCVLLQACWEFLLSLQCTWTWGHGAAAALPLSHTPPDLVTLNGKEFHVIPVGWIKSNSSHLLLHLLSSVWCPPVLLLKGTLNLCSLPIPFHNVHCTTDCSQISPQPPLLQSKSSEKVY